jgi:hypothetical protein
MTRVCLTRHCPSAGFFAPSTVCALSGLCGLARSAAIPGVLAFEALSGGKAVMPCGIRCDLLSTVLSSLEL